MNMICIFNIELKRVGNVYKNNLFKMNEKNTDLKNMVENKCTSVGIYVLNNSHTLQNYSS